MPLRRKGGEYELVRRKKIMLVMWCEVEGGEGVTVGPDHHPTIYTALIHCSGKTSIKQV